MFLVSFFLPIKKGCPGYDSKLHPVMRLQFLRSGECGVSHHGARSVMVIVIGNEHGDMSSNPGRD